MVRVKALQDVVLADDGQSVAMKAGREYVMQSAAHAVAGQRAKYVEILSDDSAGVQTATDPAAEKRETAVKAKAKAKG